MSNKIVLTPAKKMKRDSVKEERLTPASLRSLHIDTDEDSTTQPSPAASSTGLNMVEDEDEMMERFWRETGIDCAAEIASKLASSAVHLAAQYTMKQIYLEKKAAGFGGQRRVGWPGRKLPGKLLDPVPVDIPATWRVSPTYSRRAMALATPPRRLKRKADADMYPDLLGIAPLAPRDRIQSELAALSRLEGKARQGRAVARRERTKERAYKRQMIDTDSDELPDLVDDHVCGPSGCSYLSSSDEDDDTPAQNTVGNVNVIVNCGSH